MRKISEHPSRQCRACKAEYQPKGPAAKYCNDCGDFRAAVAQHFRSQAYRARRGVKVGVGSGGANRGGATVQNYRDMFRRDVWLRQEGRCYVCSTELPCDGTFLMHHVDHDRSNNVLANFEGLCKRCHQLEHDCASSLPNKRNDYP